MTSPSRRKRPTTRPSSRRTSNEDRGSRIEHQGLMDSRSSLLAPRSLWIAILTLVIWLPVPATASELRWRSESTTAADKTVSLSTGNPLRFVRPQTSAMRSDSAVRLAAFESDSPRLTSGRESETQTRSIVVNRDETPDSVRSAQLQNAGPTDGLRSPFTDTAAEPPQLPTPQLEVPSIPENNLTQPGPQTNTLPTDQQRQPVQVPSTEQPAVPPRSSQFQPVLPSGPTTEGVPQLPAPAAPTATVDAERATAKQSCEKSLENLRAYTVDKVNLNISVTGTEGQDYPIECSIDDGTQHKGRCWEQTTYMWKASAMCHKPLYFEDEQLERYGHSWSPAFQPFISGAHFFCALPVLPYCMGVEPPCECIYALGYYRPGSCAPYMCNPIPLSPRGALFEAGAVTGAAVILP